MLTATRVREALDYDPETGVFRWKIRPKNHAPIGSVAGTRNPSGRVTIMIDGQRCYANVLAWVHVTGEWPIGIVDHEDNDPTNDRFANLRPATRRQNRLNAKLSSNNAVGFKGVNLRPNGRYQAKFAGKYLGLFDTAEEGHAAYIAAAGADSSFVRSS